MKKLRNFFDDHIGAILGILVSILILVLVIDFVWWITPDKTLWDLLEAYLTGLIPIVLTWGVFLLDSQARKRELAAEERHKEDSIERYKIQLGSKTNFFALRALTELSSLVSLEDGALRGIDLYKAALQKAYFRRADLTGANLEGAKLEGADLSEANLSEANLAHAKLEGATLEGANLRGTDLRYTTPQNTTLSGAIYNKHTTKWPNGFEPEPAGAVKEE